MVHVMIMVRLDAVGVETHKPDFVDFREIEIPPTIEELRCEVSPYLPSYLPGSKHHLPENSIEKV